MTFTIFYYNTIFLLIIWLLVTFVIIFISSKVKSELLIKVSRKIGIILIVLFSIVLILICIWELFTYTFDVRNRYLMADYVYKALYNETYDLYKHLYEIKNLNVIDQEIRLRLILDAMDMLRKGDFEGYKLSVHNIFMFLSEHSSEYKAIHPLNIIRLADYTLDQYNYDNFSDIYYYCQFFVDSGGKPLNN